MSDRIAPLNDADQHERNRHNQENVNEATERCRGDNAEEPQDEKQNKNGREHGYSSPVKAAGESTDVRVECMLCAALGRKPEVSVEAVFGIALPLKSI